MFGHKTTAGDVFRGMMAGAIGGAVGAWAMNRLMPKPEHARDESSASGSHVQDQKQAAAGGGEEPAVKVAQAVSRKLFDHELSEGQKKVAGPAVHYGFGAAAGALYGGLAEVWPNAKTGLGMGYGIAVWAIGDEAVLPALRLAPAPIRVPIETHADTLSAHILYGLTLDVVRRIAKVVI